MQEFLSKAEPPILKLKPIGASYSVIFNIKMLTVS